VAAGSFRGALKAEFEFRVCTSRQKGQDCRLNDNGFKRWEYRTAGIWEDRFACLMSEQQTTGVSRAPLNGSDVGRVEMCVRDC
jgi:hypothetical protein